MCVHEARKRGGREKFFVALLVAFLAQVNTPPQRFRFSFSDVREPKYRPIGPSIWLRFGVVPVRIDCAALDAQHGQMLSRCFGGTCHDSLQLATDTTDLLARQRGAAVCRDEPPQKVSCRRPENVLGGASLHVQIYVPHHMRKTLVTCQTSLWGKRSLSWNIVHHARPEAQCCDARGSSYTFNSVK